MITVKSLRIFQDQQVALKSMEAVVIFAFQIRVDINVFVQKEFSWSLVIPSSVKEVRD